MPSASSFARSASTVGVRWLPGVLERSRAPFTASTTRSARRRSAVRTMGEWTARRPGPAGASPAVLKRSKR